MPETQVWLSDISFCVVLGTCCHRQWDGTACLLAFARPQPQIQLWMHQSQTGTVKCSQETLG